MKAKKLCSHKRKDHAYFIGLEIEKINVETVNEY